MIAALCLVALSLILMDCFSLFDLLKIAAALAFGFWWVILS
jgi:hypothetical protein